MGVKNRGRITILSFNWHEPYLAMLAGTGHEFLVVEPEITAGKSRFWDTRMRPLPENVRLLGREEAAQRVSDRKIDLAICHNARDLGMVAGWKDLPKIMVFHNKLSTEIGLSKKSEADRISYMEMLRPYLDGVELVFISESKKADWNLGRGRVIMPGIDTALYGGYEGNLATVLRVGNLLRERNLMLGFTEQQEICEGLPTTILGENPTIPGSRLSNGWDDLKMHYRSCRVFLNTTKSPYEDGYNLALLEAMATGMPILSLDNPTSPVTDGVDGYVSNDTKELSSRAREFLEDQKKAARFGEAARDAVKVRFPIAEFVENWKGVIEETVKAGSSRVSGAAKPIQEIKRAAAPKPSGKLEVSKPARIWIDYVYYPATTAHYIKRAITAPHTVVTSGASITPEVIKHWNLHNMKAEIKPQDVPRSIARDAESIYSLVSRGSKPDFFLWIDTGLDGPPAGIEKLSIPKAAYLIDTHINFDQHLKVARLFDVVFLAQRIYIPEFERAGIRNVHWLPLACDPEVHGRKDVEVIHDVGFVGSLTQAHERRKNLLEKISARCGEVSVKRLFLEEMAGHFSASRIVFNNAIKFDLNMRVFEALASGAMLLTDNADGLEDFFEDRKHLVIYNDENVADLAKYYLENSDERERIANEGMREALEKHTYRHRLEKIVKVMMEFAEKVREDGPSASVSAEGRSYFKNVRPEVAEQVPASAQRILEIGCASGETGKYLKEQKQGREVIGVEYDPHAAKEAAKVLDTVFVGDVSKVELPYPAGYFDCIVYADVLEHLVDPEDVLRKHLRLLSPNGAVVMSIPNVQHFSLVNSLIEGRWTYREEGLLDRTHLRFFTLHEIKEMLARVGLTEIEVSSKRVDDIYKEGASGTMRIGRWQVDNLTKEEMAGFFAFQYIMRAKQNQEASSEEYPPWHPEMFKEKLKGTRVTRRGDSDFLADALSALSQGDVAKAEQFAGKFVDEAGPRAQLQGDVNMALGRFEEAEASYKRAGDKTGEGLSIAGRGLMFRALKYWWDGKHDEKCKALFAKYSTGDAHPERTALCPVKKGKGLALKKHDHEIDSSWDLDYITSYDAFLYEGDIVGRLNECVEMLRTGGVLAMLVAQDGDDEGFYPAPTHRFSIEGFRKFVSLIEGISVVHIEELLRGRSFVAVLQKDGVETVYDYRKALGRLLAKNPADAAKKYWEEGYRLASGQAARGALSLNPDNADALVKMGDFFQQSGEAGKAESHYLKAVSCGGNERGNIGLGALRLASSRFNEAEEYFARAVKENPKNDRAICGLGMALFYGGKKEDGFAQLQKALSVNPENLPAVTTLHQAAYSLNKLDVAEKALKGYLDLHPANVNILFGLAGVCFTLRKYEEAKDVVEKILLLDPAHADAESLLGKIMELREVGA